MTIVWQSDRQTKKKRKTKEYSLKWPLFDRPGGVLIYESGIYMCRPEFENGGRRERPLTENGGFQSGPSLKN